MLPRRMSHASNSLRSSRGNVRRSDFFTAEPVAEPFLIPDFSCIRLFRGVDRAHSFF
jgi:hypothetical protein